MSIWPCRMRLMSWAWWSSTRLMIWDDAILGLSRSVSSCSIASRMAAPAARVSACDGLWTSSSPKYRSTTCMPGFTVVDLSATSVRRLISMPGEISM